MMQGLGQLVASYGQLPPDKLQAFKASAPTARGDGAMQGTAQIQGANVLQQGDSVTIWIDPASQMMRRVEIKTLYEKKPATFVADYRSVSNGPTYMARAVLTYPEKNVELTVDQAQGRASRRKATDSQKANASGKKDALDDALGDLNRSTNRLRRKFDPTDKWMDT